MQLGSTPLSCPPTPGQLRGTGSAVSGASLTPRPSPIPPPPPTPAPARSLKATRERGLGGKLRGPAPSATGERGLGGSPGGPAPIRRRGRAGPALCRDRPRLPRAPRAGQVPGCGPGKARRLRANGATRLAAPSDSLPAEHSAQAPTRRVSPPPPPAPPTQIPNPVGRARDTMALTHYYPTCSRLGAPFPFPLQPDLGFTSRSSLSQSDFFRHPNNKK